METKKGNGEHEAGGVAVGSPRRNEDLAAIAAGLKEMSDETVRANCDLVEPADSDDDRTRLMQFFAAVMTSETVASIRRSIWLYNSGEYESYAAKYDEADQDLVRACLPYVDKAILLNKIGRLLRDSSEDFVAGLDHFLSLASETGQEN